MCKKLNGQSFQNKCRLLVFFEKKCSLLVKFENIYSLHCMISPMKIAIMNFSGISFQTFVVHIFKIFYK